MGITNAIIVAGFNIYWLAKLKPCGWREMHNGSMSKTLSAIVWTYQAWGVVNLAAWLRHVA